MQASCVLTSHQETRSGGPMESQQAWPVTGLASLVASSQEPFDAGIPTSFTIQPLLKGMSRTKSVFSLSMRSSSSSSSTSTLSDSDVSMGEVDPLQFAEAVCRHTAGMPQTPNLDSSLRKVMDPFLRPTRAAREKRFNRRELKVDASIASSVGVPYTCLRHERPFLFDTHTHPLHEILAETLNVSNLSTVHEFYDGDVNSLLAPLLISERRRLFHSSYESFVTSFCIPLLHELAISKRLFHTSVTASDSITYRYQAFPNIHVHTPGTNRWMLPPACDIATGHSIGCLTFHVPLTPSFGTNARYVESHPGKEDWHPLTTKSVGLGYLFDGARCIHYDLLNTTHLTRVSIDFRILIYRSTSNRCDYPLDDGVLTAPDMIEDKMSRSGPGYYEEACIDLRSESLDLVVKKIKQKGDMAPDSRCGPPF